jgi:hypothetical protein
MALSAPRSFFGVHSFTPYSRLDGTFYGTIKVLKGSSLSLSGEQVELTGGSSKYPWALEESVITAEMSLRFSQFEDFLFELFLGKAPTPIIVENAGNISPLVNFKGTSMLDAATGIASVGVTVGATNDLKFGKYVVKAVTATTVNVYFSSDADIARGLNGIYQDDSLRITATPLTVVAAGVAIPNFGLTLTGGSGTIAMTVDDTATFEVRPVNNGGMTVRVGSSADSSFPEFGAIVMGQKRGNQELVELDCFRCKGAGMPLNFEQNAFAEAEVRVKVLYDIDRDGVFDIRYVKPSNS